MKIHIITVGEPKLAFAKSGWDEYFKRLQHYHSLRVTHVADKHAYYTAYLLKTCGNAYKAALAVEGKQLSSPKLANFLEKRAVDGRELCLVIGGPEGLPKDFIAQADFAWSLSELTLPHDLAMVVTLEAVYRASTISAGQPYHK